MQWRKLRLQQDREYNESLRADQRKVILLTLMYIIWGIKCLSLGGGIRLHTHYVS